MSLIAIRFLILITISFACIAISINNSSFPIIIIAMVDQHDPKPDNMSLCPDNNISPPHNQSLLHSSIIPYQISSSPFASRSTYFMPNLDLNTSPGHKFHWSPEMQGLMLGSFFWMFAVCQTPAGCCADLFGGRSLMAIALLVTGIISVVTPILTESFGAQALIALRVSMGIIQAGVNSGFFVLLCQWFPETERSMALACLSSAVTVGGIVVQFFAGYLIHNYSWTIMFYFPGVVSLIAFFVFTPCVKNRPELCGLVCREELNHIRRKDWEREPLIQEQNNHESGAHGIGADGYEEIGDVRVISRDSVPWIQIMTNGAVIAALLFKMANSLSGFVINSEIPTYFASIFHMDVREISIVNAISNVIYLVSMISVAKISEDLITREFLSRTNCRKVFSIISGSLTAISAALIPASRCDKTLAIAAFYINAILSAFVVGSDMALAAEMTDKFPGVLSAIFGTVYSCGGFLAPMMVGTILGQFPDQWIAWDIIFYSTTSLVIVTNIIFLIFGSAKIQPFDAAAAANSRSNNVTGTEGHESPILG